MGSSRLLLQRPQRRPSKRVNKCNLRKARLAGLYLLLRILHHLPMDIQLQHKEHPQYLAKLHHNQHRPPLDDRFNLPLQTYHDLSLPFLHPLVRPQLPSLHPPKLQQQQLDSSKYLLRQPSLPHLHPRTSKHTPTSHDLLSRNICDKRPVQRRLASARLLARSPKHRSRQVRCR